MPHTETDDTEGMRRALVQEINQQPKTREQLEHEYRDVWNSDELPLEFEVLQFVAPVVVVRRKCDGQLGTLMFQHSPRLYFGFQEAEKSH